LIGAEIQLKRAEQDRLDALLFGETQGRIIISVPSVFVGKITGQAEVMDIPVEKIGTVGGKTLSIGVDKHQFDWDLSKLHDAWFNSIDQIMES
jgi:phosphoribosylformylglycinamidine (FGAM) synthase-like enzyme